MFMVGFGSRVVQMSLAMALLVSHGASASEVPVDLLAEGRALRGELADVIDRRLVVVAAQEARRTTIAPGLPVSENEIRFTDTTLLHRMGEDLVGIRFTSADPELLVPELESLGATHIVAVPSAYLVECFLPVGRIGDLPSLRPIGMRSATGTFQPMTNAGSVTSQADWVMEADRVRSSAPAFDGTGIRIGTLSDSFNALGGAAAGVTSGDLPASVQIVEDLIAAGRIDEGRAMIELMHDLVPNAQHAFATAFTGEAAFGLNIERLADPLVGNCSVIVDDVFYFSEPYFQNSLVGRAVNKVTNERDVVYLSSAGNQGLTGWERVNPEAATDPGFVGTFIDFDPGPGVDTRQRIVMSPSRRNTFSLQWDDPFYTLDGVDTDVDIIILFNGGFAGVIETNNIQNQQPVEVVIITSGSNTLNVDLLFRVTSGPVPGRMKYIVYGTTTQSTEFATDSPTVSSHAAAERAVGVGAINYFNQSVPADFTSVGPSTILFNDNGSPKPAPEVRQTPVLSAMQNSDTTFFFSGNDPDGNGIPNFSGTSASAPNAAAVAAMVRQRFPAFTRDQVVARLIAGCDSSIAGPGYDNFTGHGSLNAYDAVFGLPLKAFPPLSENFESGALQLFWETTTTNNGRLLLTQGNGPHQGNWHLTMDAHFVLSDSLNAATMRTNLSDFSNVELSFVTREFSDDDHPMPAMFTESSNSDGVAYSVDGGTTWKRIVSLTGEESTNVASQKSYNLSTLAAGNGDTLGPDVRIRFQQFGTSAIPNDGMAFDNVTLTGSEAPFGWDIDTDEDGYSDAYEVARDSEPDDDSSRPNPLLGDINNDGFVTPADVAALAAAIVNGTALTTQRAGIVDDNVTNVITDDTRYNAADVTRLSNFVSGEVLILR
jgi:hypothetical protein